MWHWGGLVFRPLFIKRSGLLQKQSWFPAKAGLHRRQKIFFWFSKILVNVGSPPVLSSPAATNLWGEWELLKLERKLEACGRLESPPHPTLVAHVPHCGRLESPHTQAPTNAQCPRCQLGVALNRTRSDQSQIVGFVVWFTKRFVLMCSSQSKEEKN